MTASRSRRQIAALVDSWLVLDFFGDARKDGGGQGSSLTTTVFGQSFLAFVFAALLYPETAPIAFAAANLTLSTLLVAIGALGDEERPQRRSADTILLATAPITSLAVVLARTAHAAFHLVLVTVGLALPPAILLGFVTGQWLQIPLYLLAACACSGIATGSLATVRSLATRLLGGARATLVMSSGKAVMLGGGFVLFVLGLRAIDETADALPIGRIGAELLPTYHAARLLADPAHESWRLAAWAGVAAVLLLVSMTLTSAPTPTRFVVARRQPLRRVLHWLATGGPTLGIAEFVATTMWRSAGFRARVLPLLGLPAGMVFLNLGGERADGGQQGFVLLCVLLQLPAIYLPFLIAFLPRADQAGTGWVFEHAPGLTLAVVRDATWRAIVSHVLVPVHAAILALVLVLRADRVDAAAAALFAASLGAIAAKGMVNALPRVPFTDDHEGERGLDLGALLLAALVLGGLAAVFGALLPAALRWPAAVAAAALAGWLLSRRPSSSTEPHQAPLATGAAAVTPGAAAQAPDGKSDAAPATARNEPPIGRELRAILVLYVGLSLLPALFGAVFGR